MKRIAVCLAVAALIAMVSAIPASAQTAPTFQLGFKALAGMIPDVAGQPLENEHFNPQNGDSLQKTSTGLMVWRKADNWTAFTDGSTTWINGPFGLQSRPNDARFAWEASTPPPPPTPPAPEPVQPTPPKPAPTPAPVPPAPPKPSRTAPPLPSPDNWSGYAATKFRTGQNYTSVAGSWTVPAPKLPPGLPSGSASVWIGIGGTCMDAQCTNVDDSLIQIGTDQDAYQDGNDYFAWFEMLPAEPIEITSVPIKPGDRIEASIQMTKGAPNAPQTWQAKLTNTTTGKSWSQTVQYQSSLTSADWIVEAPWAGEVVPLANFGTITVNASMANGAKPQLAPVDGIVMMNPNGQSANVSAPAADGARFNVCFGTDTALTQCPAPK